jgi:hypothetical protein
MFGRPRLPFFICLRFRPAYRAQRGNIGAFWARGGHYCTAVFLLYGLRPLAAVSIGIGAGLFPEPPRLRASPKSAADPVVHLATEGAARGRGLLPKFGPVLTIEVEIVDEEERAGDDGQE